MDGYGNELWIKGREKSISRSTVNLAFKNGRAEQERCGLVSGPRKLGIPGCRSQLYAIFLRLGVIISDLPNEQFISKSGSNIRWHSGNHNSPLWPGKNHKRL